MHMVKKRIVIFSLILLCSSVVKADDNEADVSAISASLTDASSVDRKDSDTLQALQDGAKKPDKHYVNARDSGVLLSGGVTVGFALLCFLKKRALPKRPMSFWPLSTRDEVLLVLSRGL